jgi:protocatechuate 3,4-dioxygenase beta subunit
VSGNGGNYLRGGQRTNAAGVARFDTIFPGWYRGRTPHIHMKVIVSGHESHTGQIFFKPAQYSAVYRQGVYAARGQADTDNGEDMIYREAGTRAICALSHRGSGYAGSMTIGVDVS